MNTLAIFGAGGLGTEILEIARMINSQEPKWNDFVFINNGDTVPDIDGVRVMGLEYALSLYGNTLEAVIAVGEPTLRSKIAADIDNNQIRRSTIISPEIHIPKSTVLSEGVVICPGAYISANATLGKDVLISQNAVVGHDVILDENVVVSATCVLCGMVHVKDNAYIGPGAVVKESLTIGKFAVAAIGSVVFKDIEDGAMALGNPARVTKRSSERIF